MLFNGWERMREDCSVSAGGQRKTTGWHVCCSAWVPMPRYWLQMNCAHWWDRWREILPTAIINSDIGLSPLLHYTPHVITLWQILLFVMGNTHAKGKCLQRAEPVPRNRQTDRTDSKIGKLELSERKRSCWEMKIVSYSFCDLQNR